MVTGIFRLLILTLLVSSGCSWFRGGSNTAVNGGKIVSSAEGGDPSVTPFRLDVLSEARDGNNLKIQGQLVSKIQIPAKDVLIRLTAVDASGQERVSAQRVADLIPNGGDLNPSKPTQFSLSLPGSGISNYQLQVLWGKDAAPYLGPASGTSAGGAKDGVSDPKERREFLALQNLEVHRVPDGSCSSPEECLVNFSIKGEFFNSGRVVINDVVIVAGFAPASKMSLPNHPLENEKRIEVQNLDLAPQATKPFRLSLEKLLPASDTVAYQPVVRIVSFE
jgi:hypothetical protein